MTHKPSLRAATQCFLLTTACKLTDLVGTTIHGTHYKLHSKECMCSAVVCNSTFFKHYNLLDIHTPMGNELCGSSKREWVYMYFQIMPTFAHKYSSPGRRACCDSCHVPAYVIHLAANVACLHSLDPPPSQYTASSNAFLFDVTHVYYSMDRWVFFENIFTHKRVGLLSLDLFLNYNANSPPCRLK